MQTLFYDNYADLCRYALTFLGSKEEAEDIVQQIFLKFWESNNNKTIPANCRAYLFKTVYSRCLNNIKHQAVKRKHATFHTQHYWEGNQQNNPDIQLQTKELETAVSRALSEMNETTRQTFILSRFHGFSHKEIADTFSFSLKNVEYHIHKAIQILKIRLSVHSALWSLFFILYQL